MNHGGTDACEVYKNQPEPTIDIAIPTNPEQQAAVERADPHEQLSEGERPVKSLANVTDGSQSHLEAFKASPASFPQEAKDGNKTDSGEDRTSIHRVHTQSNANSAVKSRTGPVGNAATPGAVFIRSSIRELEAAVDSKIRATSSSAPHISDRNDTGASASIEMDANNCATRDASGPAAALKQLRNESGAFSTKLDPLEGSNSNNSPRLDLARGLGEPNRMQSKTKANMPPSRPLATSRNSHPGFEEQVFEKEIQQSVLSKGALSPFVNKSGNTLQISDIGLRKHRGLAGPIGQIGREHGSGNSSETGKLAVAIAVKDDNESSNIPSAIEFDPDAKPPIFKNRRFRLYGLLASILLLVISGGVVLGTVVMKGEDGIESNDDISLRETLGIQEAIELEIGSAMLRDPATAQYQALQWILHEDPMQLDTTDSNLVQRYLHVYFYLETSKGRPWKSCNRPSPSNNFKDDCLHEIVVKVSPLTYEATPWKRWLGSTHECRWAGVICDEFNQTRGIQLGGQEMTGTLPVELSQLPLLQSLDLSWNAVTGTIPLEYGEMRHLINLEIHHNLLTGSVPTTIWRSKRLQRLNIGGNMLSGNMPTVVGRLSSMKGLFMYSNNFGGTLPTELGNLSLITYFRANDNEFTGTIPTEIGSMTDARSIWLQSTNLQGTIPSEIFLLEFLNQFRIANTTIGGTIPEEIYASERLSRLDFHASNISGSISTLIGKMRSLEILNLHNCEFTGTVPTEIGKLSKLRVVKLFGNNLKGPVPEEVCDLRGPLSGLEIIAADCEPNDNGIAAMPCRSGCCTKCCIGGDDDIECGHL